MEFTQVLRLKILFALSLLLLSSFILYAQEEEPSRIPVNRINQRALGEQTFAISGGVNIPLFTLLLNDNPGVAAGARDSKLNLGGGGALAYSFYISPNIKLGLRFSANFTQDINNNWLYLVPVVVRGAYEFHPLNQLSIPVHLGLGISFTTWNTDFLVDPMLSAGFGVYFDWSADWSFGVDFSYLFIAELASKNPESHAIVNFLEIFLSVKYHF